MGRILALLTVVTVYIFLTLSCGGSGKSSDNKEQNVYINNPYENSSSTNYNSTPERESSYTIQGIYSLVEGKSSFLAYDYGISNNGLYSFYLDYTLGEKLRGNKGSGS